MNKHAAILLHDKQGRILLQFRDGQSRYPYTWSFFGGGTDGENPKIAARREIEEEIGVEVALSTLTQLTCYTMPDHHVCVFDCDQPIDWSDIVLREGAGCGFFHWNELKHLRLSPVFRMYLTQENKRGSTTNHHSQVGNPRR